MNYIFTLYTCHDQSTGHQVFDLRPSKPAETEYFDKAIGYLSKIKIESFVIKQLLTKGNQ